MVAYSSNLIMSNNLKFKFGFQKSNGLKAYLSFLRDEEFVQKNLNLSMNPFRSATLYILDYITLNLSVLSNNSEDYRVKWHEMDAIDILLKTATTKSTTLDYCYNTILYIATDKQIETLTEIHDYSNTLISRVEATSNDFINDRFNRQKRQILEEDGIVNIEVHCVRDSNNLFTPIRGVLNSLYIIAVNDKLKQQLYFDTKLKEYLKVIIRKGNNIEIKYSLNLLSQLSLNRKIAIDLNKDTNFLDELESIINDNQSIKKKYDQIKWNLKEIENEQNKLESSNENSVSNEQSKLEHIMISYNTVSRELCLKIKENLESSGYKVWIDINDIHGSSLDSMARAVENSFCVLMCVTEKYRQSVNCQAEAQYAFRLNKPIIPLIMQKGYESVSGWLGNINYIIYF